MASYTYSLTVAAATTTTSSCTDPSCYKTITNRPFSALNELGWRDASTTIVTDPTAPASPSNVGQAYYPAGFVEGSAPVNSQYYGIATLNYTQVYLSFWVKLSSNWQPDPVSINKIGFVWIHGNPSVVMTNYGAAFPLTPLVGLQNVPPGSFYLRQNVNTVTLANDGAWHHWEIQLIANTPGIANGTVRWWLDGTKLGEYTDVQFSGVGQGNTWQYFYWNPTWGGNSGATVRQDMYMWMDDLYASGAP
jgi:hypothetical protein